MNAWTEELEFFKVRRGLIDLSYIDSKLSNEMS